jgi:hypothetical protein
VTQQLYDLVRDPYELLNLATDPPHSDVVGDLRTRLERWMRVTGDPLLDGPVAPPAGAEFNLPEQLSAAEPTRTAKEAQRDGRSLVQSIQWSSTGSPSAS